MEKQDGVHDAYPSPGVYRGGGLRECPQSGKQICLIIIMGEQKSTGGFVRRPMYAGACVEVIRIGLLLEQKWLKPSQVWGGLLRGGN